MSDASGREVTGIVAVLGHPEEISSGFPWSAALARQAGVPLTLLHVIDPVNSTELPENAIAMAKDMLTLLGASKAVEGLSLHRRVETGMPEAVLPEIASEAEGAVLVLAAGDHGAFARSLLRRGRENVIHHLRSPFVLLPPRVGQPVAIDRAVVGMDESPLANQAAGLAKRLSPGVTMVEVEVLEPGSLALKEYLAFVPQLSGTRIRMRGRAGIAILSAARTTDADLIVVGGHGRTGLRGRHLGGTAQWLSHHADRPLLVFPEGRAVQTG
ncbi:MAG TPA: universal stress protein [Tepidiformaceae bacterium]|nr:universal stress protein [Tepidiformaceae bacterium]